DVRELRHARALLTTNLKVGGYVTWIYDCVADNLKPGKTRAQVQATIDDDPTLCERPKFHLGATRDAADEVTLGVVCLPRPPNKLEPSHLPKDELAKRPPVPKLAVGDYVIVSGKFDTSSPHSERNSDGLLVYAALDHAKPPATAPAIVPLPAIKLTPPA